jgi:transposase-like protein
MLLPTIWTLLPLFQNESACLQFLLNHNAIYRSFACENCGADTRREASCFRCLNISCRSRKSLLHQSFFAKTHLKPTAVLFLGYLWLSRTNFEQACIYSGHSRQTVSAFYKHYRQLIADTLDEDDTIIGGVGVGVEVEIDESKFGKRKFNRGHRVEGCWVLGGVERTTERRMFVITVSDRRAITLLSAIKTHVREGSIILTDLWKGYMQLNSELGFDHFSVNHSKNFRDPSTGVHTNTIEGTWNGIKLTIAPRARNKESIEERLLEFIWRRKHAGDLWTGLIDAFQSIKYL